MRENRPLVATVDELGRTSNAERRYKTKSFISYPITIGSRRFGVLNLADKVGGGAYDLHDLSVIDLVAPQIALALERAAWQQRANPVSIDVDHRSAYGIAQPAISRGAVSQKS
jgi:hypothetical protein